jgi:hypothetical protein
VIGRSTPVAPRILSQVLAATKTVVGCAIMANAVLYVVGIGWGLPASDGWDNDGVAPRDFLAGLVETVTPGHFFRYPPVHLALLALLGSPASIVALARTRSLSAPDVVAQFIRVPIMTVFSGVGRAVSVVMALGVVWALAKMAEEIKGRAAAGWTAVLAGTSVPLVYYAHTSNLDVPCLFWSCLAVLSLVQAAGRSDATLLRRGAVFAALAVGTKDQACAVFAGAVPVSLGLWAALDDTVRSPGRVLARNVLRAGVTFAALLLVIEGPLYNPRGFVRRMAFLAGPASQPFAQYTNDWLGRATALRDTLARVVSCYPAAFMVPLFVGTVVALRPIPGKPGRFVAALVPLLAALSFTLLFNCVARRADHRFVLVQAAMASVYAGVGLDALFALARPVVARAALSFATGGAFAWALYAAADVDANLVLDPRYDAEGWLRQHASPGEVVETYGLNAYLPRFPAGVIVHRVGPDPVLGRSALPGVVEVDAKYGDAPARRPRLLVIPEAWVGRYLADPESGGGQGHMLAPAQRAAALDRDPSSFFGALRRGHIASYRLAHASVWEGRFWAPLDMHASTAKAVWIYERTE